MSYRVHLQKFEGPLPLLLYLIRKDEMDIFDINIFEITTQYMEHIRLMKELDLEVAGDFVAMAATLLQIKSRMLLPNYSEDGEVIESEDPRKELVQMLLEYQKYQAAGKNLLKRYILGRDVFGRGATYRAEDQMGAVVIEADNALFALIGAYRRSIKKMKSSVHQVKAKTLSIAARILQIKDRLIVGRRVLLSDIVAADAKNLDPKDLRTQLLITFLSILELGRLGFVSLFQTEVFSGIHIEAKTEIATNGLDRVQEFDANENAGLSDKLFQQHAKAPEKFVIDMTSDDPASDVIATEAAPLSNSFELDGLDGLDLEDQIAGDITLDAATDEEILNAELELELETSLTPTEVVTDVSANEMITEAHQEAFHSDEDAAINIDSINNKSQEISAKNVETEDAEIEVVDVEAKPSAIPEQNI